MDKYILIKRIQLLLLFFLFSIVNTSLCQPIEASFEGIYKRYQKNEPYKGDISHNWGSIAWKGERINKQILIWSDEYVDEVSYDVSDLVSEENNIPSSNVKLLFGKYVKGDPEARSCGAYPTRNLSVEIIDALSEIPITQLSEVDPIKLWLSIDVPISAKSGNYSGTITINSGTHSSKLSINVRVVEYSLPEASKWSFHLDIWQFPVSILNRYNDANPNNKIVVWSDEHFKLFQSTYKLLASAGQKSITTYIKQDALGAESMIKWIKKNDGTWDYDFDVFDKYVNNLMSLGITKQISCFSPVGWNESKIPYWDEASNSNKVIDAPLGSSIYNTRWNHFLTSFKVHLDKKGWFDIAVLYLDEVSKDKLSKVTSLVHENNPNWKLGIAYSHGLPNDIKGEFYDLSGILEDASNDGVKDGNISTFYTSCTQVRPNNYITPENSPAEMTWMAWHSINEGYDGYLRWAFDNWKSKDPFDAREGTHTAGDFSMVYRSSNSIGNKTLTSVRFEALREGIQDFEKIKILISILNNSSSTEDRNRLTELNNIIKEFDKSSGVRAEELILKGKSLIGKIVLSQNLSLDSNKTFGFNIYPNPNSGIFNINIPEINNYRANIQFINSFGIEVASKNYSSFNSLETISLTNNIGKGLYLIRVFSGEKTYQDKLIIQ